MAWASRPSSLRSQCTWLPRPDRHAVGQHLHDAAEGVAGLGRRLDLGDHRLLGGLRRSTAPASRRPRRGRPASGRCVGLRAGRPHLHDVAQDLDAELAEQLLGQRARRPPGPPSRGRWPARARRGRRRSRTSACPARSAWPGPGLGERGCRDRPAPATSPRATCRCGSTRCCRSRWRPATQRAAVADAAEQRDVVLLEAHARPAPEAQPPAGQLGLDLLDRDRQARGQALDDHDQGLAVGLARGEEAQHRGERTGPGAGVPGLDPLVGDAGGRGRRRVSRARGRRPCRPPGPARRGSPARRSRVRSATGTAITTPTSEPSSRPHRTRLSRTEPRYSPSRRPSFTSPKPMPDGLARCSANSTPAKMTAPRTAVPIGGVLRRAGRRRPGGRTPRRPTAARCGRADGARAGRSRRERPGRARGTSRDGTNHHEGAVTASTTASTIATATATGSESQAPPPPPWSPRTLKTRTLKTRTLREGEVGARRGGHHVDRRVPARPLPEGVGGLVHEHADAVDAERSPVAGGRRARACRRGCTTTSTTTWPAPSSDGSQGMASVSADRCAHAHRGGVHHDAGRRHVVRGSRRRPAERRGLLGLRPGAVDDDDVGGARLGDGGHDRPAPHRRRRARPPAARPGRRRGRRGGSRRSRRRRCCGLRAVRRGSRRSSPPPAARPPATGVSQVRAVTSLSGMVIDSPRSPRAAAPRSAAAPSPSSTSKARNSASSPAASKAALCSTGESEWRMGEPSTAATRVVAVSGPNYGRTPAALALATFASCSARLVAKACLPLASART